MTDITLFCCLRRVMTTGILNGFLKFVSECGARPAPYSGKLPHAKQIMTPAQAHKEKKLELVSAENVLGRICARAV